jgi:hypothetical protein
MMAARPATTITAECARARRTCRGRECSAGGYCPGSLRHPTTARAARRLRAAESAHWMRTAAVCGGPPLYLYRKLHGRSKSMAGTFEPELRSCYAVEPIHKSNKKPIPADTSANAKPSATAISRGCRSIRIMNQPGDLEFRSDAMSALPSRSRGDRLTFNPENEAGVTAGVRGVLGPPTLAFRPGAVFLVNTSAAVGYRRCSQASSAVPLAARRARQALGPPQSSAIPHRCQSPKACRPQSRVAEGHRGANAAKLRSRPRSPAVTSAWRVI